MCLNTTVSDSADLRQRKGNASPASVVTEAHQSFQKEESQPSTTTTSYTTPTKHSTTTVTTPVKSPYREKGALEKLFTSKEESHVFHVHKILGISALVSYIYRFAHCGERDGNFGPTLSTLFFLFHHWLLNASSFIFQIPAKRIRDGGFRIWPEYRFHSLVFASRSLACMLLIWYEQRYQPEEPYYFMDTVIVLATCAAADFGSSLQGENRSNTVRGTTYTDPYGLWFASEMQFNLTACTLIGLRRYTMHLVAVCIIQVNSFLMTLRRKNVASHEVLTAGYGVMLIIGLWIAVLEDDYNDMMLPTGTVGSVAVILRMGPLHMNKYVMWTLLGVGLQAIRYYNLVEVVNTEFWMYSFFVTKIIALGLGLRKRSQKMKEGQDARLVYVGLASHAALFGLIYYNYFVVGWEE